MKWISLLLLAAALLTGGCSGKPDKLDVPPAANGMNSSGSLAWAGNLAHAGLK